MEITHEASSSFASFAQGFVLVVIATVFPELDDCGIRSQLCQETSSYFTSHRLHLNHSCKLAAGSVL